MVEQRVGGTQSLDGPSFFQKSSKNKGNVKRHPDLHLVNMK